MDGVHVSIQPIALINTTHDCVRRGGLNDSNVELRTRGQ